MILQNMRNIHKHNRRDNGKRKRLCDDIITRFTLQPVYKGIDNEAWMGQGCKEDDATPSEPYGIATT